MAPLGALLASQPGKVEAPGATERLCVQPAQLSIKSTIKFGIASPAHARLRPRSPTPNPSSEACQARPGHTPTFRTNETLHLASGVNHLGHSDKYNCGRQDFPNSSLVTFPSVAHSGSPSLPAVRVTDGTQVWWGEGRCMHLHTPPMLLKTLGLRFWEHVSYLHCLATSGKQRWETCQICIFPP